MNKIKKLLLLTVIASMFLSLSSIDLGVKAFADEHSSSSNIIDDKDPESIDGDTKPNEGTQHQGGQFNDNKTISDSIDTSGIATTTTENAYVDNNSTDYHMIDTHLPKVTPTWGDYTRVHNMAVPNNYTSIDSINTGATTFKTKWFLPEGFHVSPGEHGNYQGGIIVNDSIYLVESAGTNTNKGAIVKIKLDALKSLGIDDSTQQNILAKVFNFFNRNSIYGSDRNKKLSQFIVNTNPYRTENSKSKTNIGKINKKIAASKSRIQKGLKKFNIAANPAKKKLVKSIKANRKNFNQLNKRHKNKSINKKIAKLNKSYKKMTNKKNHPDKLAPKPFKTYNGIKKRENKLIRQYNQKVEKLNKKIAHNNKEINRIGQRNGLFKKYFDLSKLIQVSPITNIGHGQTLSYNPSNNHVYIAQDDKLGTVDGDFYNQVTEMDAQTMNPVHVYRFKLNNKGHYYAIHTLTFDNEGNAYFGIHGGPKSMKNAYTLFHGKMDDNGIRFSPVKGLINWPASFNQGVTYNRNNNRLYLLSNDMIISIPADEVRNDNIQPQDVHYTTFGTNREFESLSFDNNGYGYLVVLWRSELLKSTQPLN